MAVSAHGTALKISDGEAFVTVAEVLDIDGPGVTSEAVTYRGDGDVSLVLPDAGDPVEMTFELNYTAAATQTFLLDAANTRALASFQVEFPTVPAQALAFDGYVTGFQFSAPVEGILRASVTITLASVLTLL